MNLVELLANSSISEARLLGGPAQVNITQIAEDSRRVEPGGLFVAVRGRSSDNTLITAKLGWAPSIRLRDGMEKTYRWIHDQMTTPAAQRRAYV